MKAILAAIDFSPVSKLVVTEAAALARALGGKVVLLTVLAEPIYVKEYAPPPRSVGRISIGEERAVRRRLGVIQAQLQSEFVPAEIVMRRGSASYQILNAADGHEAALIVIGSHGHTALYELILGGTAQAVLKRARQPVVIIPPKMRQRRRARVRIMAVPVEK